jgi:hypothetical protein
VHLFNDHPELGWSTIAIADGDAGLAERTPTSSPKPAESRTQLPPEFIDVHTATEARAARLARKLGCVSCPPIPPTW